MTDTNSGTLEQALIKVESDVNATLKSAKMVENALKKTSDAAKTGNLKDLPKLLEAAGQGIAALQQQFAGTSEGWTFSGDEYIAGREYINELVEAARAQDVNIFEQDGLLYCYPFLLRILPGELSVQIDKTKDKRLRPSALAAYLKAMQNRPVRFKPEAFLECLYEAYLKLTKTKEDTISLQDIYKLLTLLPGQAKRVYYSGIRTRYLPAGQQRDQSNQRRSLASIPCQHRDKNVGESDAGHYG